MIVSKALAARFVAFFNQGALLDCWEWQGPVDHKGFGVLDYRGENIPVHVIAFAHFRYPPLEGTRIERKCENPLCVNPYHLRARLAQCERTGARNYNAKLHEKDVAKIREQYAHCQSTAIVARAFDVSEGTVRDIIKGRTWTHV